MRADLLALTLDGLTILANVGLVKRAQKDIEAGAGPKLEETDDTTVIALFKDGATTRLPPNTPLKNASCSCGSTSVCRHRVGAVLAYQKLHGASVEQAPAREAWSPAEFTDDALRMVCGEAAPTRAAQLIRGSFVVTTRAGDVPVASLPSSTVQFLVPRDLAFAKCDCTKGHACEHVVIAVWAFRKQPNGIVELGTVEDAATHSALEHVEPLLRSIVESGALDDSVAAALRLARATADQAKMVWMVDAMEDLERQKEAYDRQSALFSGRGCSELVAEIAARARAARASSHGLPSRWIVGADEPRETPIEQARLTSIGARLYADGDRRIAMVYFAERDTRAVLVLRKEWIFPAGEQPRNGHDLGQMFASSRLSLAALAKGDLITRAAKRRANGTIDLSVARGMQSSVLPADKVWADLPEPILVRDLAAYARANQDQPPWILRPRRIGDHVRVVAVGRVDDVGYDPAQQRIVGHLQDLAGNPFRVITSHRAVSPGAVDAVHTWLASTKATFVSGALKTASNTWEIEPLAIVGERLLIPDLEKPARQAIVAPHASEESRDELGALIDDLRTFVERGIIKGIKSIQPSAKPLAQRLREASMPRTAALIDDQKWLDLVILAAVLA